MARRGDPGQLDLFGDSTPVDVPAPRQGPKTGFGGKADAVVELLDQVHQGRFGVLESTDRVVCIDAERHCWHAPAVDAAMVESLIAQRYAKPVDVEPLLHGAVRRNVVLLALTPGGRGLLRRSSILQTKRPR